jgi:hypothetical protein
MSSSFEQNVDNLPSTSEDIIGKRKSTVQFPCMLCGRSHQSLLFHCIEEASKLLEDMTLSQPQLSTPYCNLTLNPPVVDGMINLVPLLVSSVDLVVNLVMSLVEPVDQVVDLILSSVDPTLSLVSETQAVDLFPPVDPILPLVNETQVVDLIPSSVDPLLLVLDGITPSPIEPPPSNEAILFYWGALTGPCIPFHIPLNIVVHVYGRDVPQMMIDKGSSVIIFPSVACQDLVYPQLV